MENRKIEFPEIDKRQLDEMVARVRPIRRFARGRNGLFPQWTEGELCYLDVRDPRKDSLFDAKATRVVKRKLRIILRISVHFPAKPGDQGRFLPRFASVLAFVRTQPFWRKIVAFEIVEHVNDTIDGKLVVAIYDPNAPIPLSGATDRRRIFGYSAWVAFYERLRPRKARPAEPTPKLPGPGASMRARMPRMRLGR